MEDRIFSIFKVYDYKGGELSSSTNMNFEDVVSEIIESGNLKHPEISYWEDLYEIADENELERICSELKYESDLYAGGDEPGTVMVIFEHKNNKLVGCNADEFISSVKQEILKNK